MKQHILVQILHPYLLGEVSIFFFICYFVKVDLFIVSLKN